MSLKLSYLKGKTVIVTLFNEFELEPVLCFAPHPKQKKIMHYATTKTNTVEAA